MGTAFREQPLFTISPVLSSFLGPLSHYSILKAVSLLPHQYAFLLLHLHLRSSNRRAEKKNTKRVSPPTLGATVSLIREEVSLLKNFGSLEIM